MHRRNANHSGRIPRGLRLSAVCAGVCAVLAESAVGQGAPGIEIPLNQSVLLTPEPGTLTTFAAAFPPAPGGFGIRYQVDIAWLTPETPSPGVTHDSFFLSLQSIDGLETVPLFGVDVFGLHLTGGGGFSLQIEPLARPDPALENSLAYRVFISPPDSFRNDGSWALIDIADTAGLGDSLARVTVAMVPEPGTMALAVPGILFLWWAGRRSRTGGLR
jgi:hypothetical protein